MTILPSRTRWIALLVLCLGTLMIVLDTTIVNVALPSIQRRPRLHPASLAWVVNAYMLTFGGFLLLGGRLGDLFGHRRRVPARHRAVHARLARLRARDYAGDARRGARRPGPRRRRRVGGLALAHRWRCSPSRRERAKAMGVFGFVVRRRRQHRRAARRRPHRARSAGTGSSSSTCRSGCWCLRCARGSLPPGHSPAGRPHLDVGGAVTVTAALMLAVYAIVNGNTAGWTSAQTLVLLARRGSAARRCSSRSSAQSARRWCRSASSACAISRSRT